jgi:hypothetical protein
VPGPLLYCAMAGLTLPASRASAFAPGTPASLHVPMVSWGSRCCKYACPRSRRLCDLGEQLAVAAKKGKTRNSVDVLARDLGIQAGRRTRKKATWDIVCFRSPGKEHHRPVGRQNCHAPAFPFSVVVYERLSKARWQA